MCRKIWCDGESWKILGTKQGVNRAFGQTDKRRFCAFVRGIYLRRTTRTRARYGRMGHPTPGRRDDRQSSCGVQRASACACDDNTTRGRRGGQAGIRIWHGRAASLARKPQAYVATGEPPERRAVRCGAVQLELGRRTGTGRRAGVKSNSRAVTKAPTFNLNTPPTFWDLILFFLNSNSSIKFGPPNMFQREW